MVTWFDLPSEVKQIIFGLISEADSIIYVPRDRRRKIDVTHDKAHHFHGLLLVSKNFIRPDEFAFSILKSAKVTFTSHNEIRRLIDEVAPAFKQRVRRIRIVRENDDPRTSDGAPDRFSSFSSIDSTLSTHLPELRQIFISWPEYCAEVTYFKILQPTDGGTRVERCLEAIDSVLNDGKRNAYYQCEVMRQNPLSQMVASFIGNRSSRAGTRNWTRPIPWIRRLSEYAEKADIEIVHQLKLCFPFVARTHRNDIFFDDNDSRVVETTCYSINGIQWPKANWQIHLDAHMSSKDYMMRVEHRGEEYRFHQQLAYDMLHGDLRRGQRYWIDMVRDVRQKRFNNEADYF